MVIKNNKNLLTIIIISSGIVIGLLLFLAFESYFFTQRARDLIRMKEDYANYILAFKRMIAANEPTSDEEVESDTRRTDKKKKYTHTDDEFLVVSRDFDYLQRHAYAYARGRNIESAIRALYQRSTIDPQRTLQPIPKKRRRRHPRTVQKHTVAIGANNVASLQEDYPFIWPLKRNSFWLSSPFGPRRKPNGSWGFHYGLDMAAPLGTIIKAVATGVVIEARYARGFGKTVLIAHGNKLKTRYAHLSKIEVRVGDRVEQGECIGRVGNTGNTRGRNGGVHLHFEVLVYGKQVNPHYFLR